MCAMTRISRASYYRQWLTSRPLEADTEIREQLQILALQDRHCGYRRLTRKLNNDGVVVNHKRVLRLMREDNLLCLRKKAFVPTATDSKHSWQTHHNLARGMQTTALNQLWVADSILNHSAKAIEIEDIETRVATLEREAQAEAQRAGKR